MDSKLWEMNFIRTENPGNQAWKTKQDRDTSFLYRKAILEK